MSSNGSCFSSTASSTLHTAVSTPVEFLRLLAQIRQKRLAFLPSHQLHVIVVSSFIKRVWSAPKCNSWHQKSHCWALSNGCVTTAFPAMAAHFELE